MMKTFLKQFGLIVGLLFVATSCEDELTVGSDEELNFNNGISVVTFSAATVNAAIEVNGEVQTYNLPIRLQGPNIENLTQDITVNYSIDEANSTAESGVNFTLESTSITLTAENNYLGSIPVEIITEGIEPPNEVKIVLQIDEVDTTLDNIVVSGNTSEVSLVLNYLCFADLSGTYTMTNSVCGAEVTDITISKNDDGTWYLSTADGGLLQYCSTNTSLQNDGNILVACGEVKPTNDLGFCGSNGIGCITGGSWDPETGTLTLEHSQSFFSWASGTYTSTYVRNN